MNLATLAELFSVLNPENLVLVFNQCKKSATKKKAMDYFYTALKSLGNNTNGQKEKIPNV